ncbi:MAG: hypothetical protein J6F30_08890 [Cellulosilyticum sp.]|nr:hypothetical protein [Cellulosilyticum sp.]
MKKYLSSRKFLLTFASFCGSLGAAIAGLHTDNETLVVVGIICSAVSVAIYTAVEGLVDATATTNRSIEIRENVSRETLERELDGSKN